MARLPASRLSASRVLDLLGGPRERSEVEAALFASKAELKRWEGDELEVEVTPDRLDLLSEGGLGLHLQGSLGVAHGLPTMPSADGSGPLAIEVDASVAPLRPEIAGVVVSAPNARGLDEGLLAEAIRFQELLHATVGADRRLASLGIYPALSLASPVRYALEDSERVRFVPLDGARELSGTEFFRDHPMAARYGAYGTRPGRVLTLRDGDGQILSLPPILNSRTGGEAKVGERRLLLESTGTLRARVQDAVGLFLLPFVARGWSVAPVAVTSGGGRDPGEALVRPRTIDLDAGTLEAVAGQRFSAAEVGHLFARARLGAHGVSGGYRVGVPPWRPDLLAEVDLVEDLLLARGLDVTAGVRRPSWTMGRRLPETRFRRRTVDLLLGLGFSELRTPVLVGRETIERLGRVGAIRLKYPPSNEFAVVRDALQPSLLAALERNVRVGYPQRFAEVGPVVVRDPSSESGGATRFHAAAFLAREGAGLADAAALVDYLMGAFGAVGVREPVELPGTIPGRAARVRLAGEPVAELGELHPELLSQLRVPVPVAWAEVDLSALWPLVRRETA